MELEKNYTTDKKILISATLTITSGGQETNESIDLEGASFVSLLLPTAWGTINLTVKASDTKDGTYYDVYDAGGTLVTVTGGGADRWVSFTGAQLQAIAPLRFIKLKAASAVVANRAIKVLAKG